MDVAGDKDFYKYYEKLNDYDTVKLKLREIIREMENDINKGDLIKHKPYPKKYVDKHDVTNLFVYNLPNARRLIYTIRGSHSRKAYQFLECLTHKEYDVTFGYHTS